MQKKLKIIWTQAAVNELGDILEYSAVHHGFEISQQIYQKLTNRIDSLAQDYGRSRITSELKEYGISLIRDIYEKPFRIFLKVDRQKVILLGILDGRRDIEQIVQSNNIQHS